MRARENARVGGDCGIPSSRRGALRAQAGLLAKVPPGLWRRDASDEESRVAFVRPIGQLEGLAGTAAPLPASGRIRATARFHDALRRSRMPGELLGGATRPRYQFTTAVRAHSFEDSRGTEATKRALEGANECIGRLRRQVPIAAFAIGPKLKHWRTSGSGLLMPSRCRSLDPGRGRRRSVRRHCKKTTGPHQ
jgi:hypothetical protein